MADFSIFDGHFQNDDDNDGLADSTNIADIAADHTQTRLNASMGEAFKVNPDQQAHINKLSRESAVPVDAVAVDPDSVERDVKLNNIDTVALTRDNPTTADYLSDYNNASIAHDDVERLKALESSLQQARTPSGGADPEHTNGYLDNIARLTGERAVGLSGNILASQGVAFQGRGVDESDLDRSLASELMGSVFEAGGAEIARKARGLFGAEEKHRVDNIKSEFAAGNYWSVLAEVMAATPEVLGQSVPDMAATVASPMLYFGGRNYEMATNRAQNDGRDEPTLDDLNSTAPFAAGSVVLERIVPAGLMNRLGGDVVTDYGNVVLSNVAKNIAVDSTQEGLTEGFQTVLEYTGERFGTEAEIKLGELGEEVFFSTLFGTTSGTVMSGTTEAVNTSRALLNREQIKENQAAADQITIDNINDNASESTLRERDNEAFKQFVEESDGDNNTTLFIDGVQTQLYLADKRQQVDSDPALKLLAEKADEAALLGSDIAIPVSEFAATLAGTEHFTQLRDSMTLSEEVQAPFRQEQSRTDTDNYIKSLMEEAQQNTSNYVEAQEIYETVRAQLVDSGAVSRQNAAVMAQVVPAWAAVYAQRNNVSIREAFENSGLTIEGPQTGEASRLANEAELLSQARESGFEGDSVVEAREHQQAVDKGLDMSHEARMQRAADMGFDTGTTYYHGTDVDFTHFKLSDEGINLVGRGVYAADSRTASGYASGEGDVIYPIHVKGEKATNQDAADAREAIGEDWNNDLVNEWLSERGFTHRDGRQGIVIFDPKNVRSVNAAFDPDFTDSPELLAQESIEQTVTPDNSDVVVTGRPITFNYAHNKDSATAMFGIPDKDSPFERGFEPSGKYMIMVDESFEPFSGANMEVGVTTFQNPLVVDMTDGKWKEGLSNQYDGKTGKELSKAVIADGYDGIVTKRDGDVDEIIDFKSFDESKALFQKTPDEKNLFVTHNLSTENLLAAADLGGLAAPSIAVARSDISEFEGFGEISLLAEPSLLESPKARTFDADIYSPRQPHAEYDINLKKFNELNDTLNEDGDLGLSRPDIQSLEQGSGADNLQRSTALQYKWLQDQGKAPKLKKRKVEPAIRQLAKLDVLDVRDEKFQAIAKKHFTKLLEKVAAADEGRVDRYRDFYFLENGKVKPNKLFDLEAEARRFKQTDIDTGQLRQDIDKKFRVKKTRDEYDAWVTEQFNNMVDGKRLFKGFTDAGNRKHVDYNMQNIVKEMTQKLQAGESSFYGAGTVRSAYANEMKTIEQIQAKRDDIVTEEDMTMVKQESADVFEHAMDKLKPFYKFDADSWGYTDDAGSAIIEGPKGLREAFNVTPEVEQIVADLTEYLAALPSSYFEAKIQRAVGFNEFHTAVVPKGANKQAVQVLKDAGLKIKTYDPSGKGKTRQQVIAEQNKLLFQERTGVTRGYYDPANSVIRLTEAADLSTFLHEFAHFMYEMELTSSKVSPDSINTIEGIHNWYKRNADDVAKEASGYLDRAGDQLGQKSIDDDTVEARLQRARDQGFDTDTVWYKGMPAQDLDGQDITSIQRQTPFPSFFKDPDTGEQEPGVKIAGFFAKSQDTANHFSKVLGQNTAVFPVYLRTRAPLIIDAQGKKAGEIQFGESGREFRENIRSGNYDSVIIENTADEGDIAIPIDPENIRSVNAQFLDSDSDQLLAQEDTPITATGEVTPEQVNQFLDEGTTGDRGVDAAIRRAVHEQFARGFETYVMEGKAPSSELRNAFRTFARWLTQVYRAVRGDLNVNLDDQMRKVFDRLLATDEQIAAAEANAQYQPMFKDAEASGMTEDEFQNYSAQVEKTRGTQTEKLRDKMIDELTRQTKKWWKDEKADIVDEQLEELSNERVYRAREGLKNGEFKLDHATVKELKGQEKTDKRGIKSVRIPSQLNGMTVKGAQGVHPDEAAAFFGYNSGDEMLTDLIQAPSIKEQAETNAENIMLDRHGDMLNDGAIEAQADEAVRNEERGKLLLSELKALNKGNVNGPRMDRATIKQLAKENIAKLSFKQIHPGKYRKAELRAAQEAAAALATGDKETAARAKSRQILNFYLGNAAVEARNETMKIVDRMARYNKKKVREEIQRAENGYWEQIVKILNRFEFRKSATLRSVDQVNENINTWSLNLIENNGDALVLSPAVLNESYLTHWKNVPFADLQGINDSVKNIEHVARYSNKMRLEGEAIDFKKFVQNWTNHMRESSTTRFTPVASVADKPSQAAKFGRWSMAQMTKIPFMASWLDGGERAGMSHDALVQPFTDAYNEEVQLWKEVGEVVMNAIENRSKDDLKRHNTKVFIPEIAGTAYHTGNMMGHEILAVALNTGNAGNLRKMLLGEGWANPDVEAEMNINNAKLQAVLSHMTKSDWELVQLVWDQMDQLYPRLAEVHRKTTGLVPPKVEATPVKTAFGEFKGGYYPVKYDPDRSHKAKDFEDQLNAETDSMFSNSSSIHASVAASAINERTKYYAPIRLSLDVVPAHFQESIHYITHHDAVRQTNKLIRNDEVRTVITEKLGPEEYAQLKPWLNDIAKDGREAPAKMFWDKMIQRLRFGTTLGVMGFKASTGIIQISGLANSVAELGLAPVYKSMRSILGSPQNMKDAWEFASSNSKVLNHRVNTMDREIKNAMQKLEGKRGILAAAQELSMKHIALIQTYMVDLPTWQAAYIKEMEESGDAAKAFKRADWTIENVQGSGVTKDMAQIMRGQSETARMLTMFMTFFSSLWNLERDLVKGARSGRYSPTTVGAKALFLLGIPVLFEMFMRGEFGEAEDEEELLQKTLTKTALYPIASIPFVRDIATAATGEFGYNMSPIAQLIESGTRTIPSVVKNGFTDDEITEGQIKGATKFIGAAAGVPGISQAWATGEHIHDVMVEGEELTVHQLLFGPKRD